MKKYLFIFYLLSTSVLLHAAGATLRILSDPGSQDPFVVIINGIQQNEAPVLNIEIKELPYEVYGLELKPSNSAMTFKGLVFLRIGDISSYSVVTKNNKLELSHIKATDKPYRDNFLSLVFKSEAKPLPSAQLEDFSSYASPSIVFDDVDDGFNDVPANQATNQDLTPPDLSKLKFNADSMFKAIRDRHLSEAPEPCKETLSNDQIKELRAKMRDFIRLEERADWTLNQLKNKCLTVDQVKDLLKLLDGDDLKLSFYKNCYRQITDIERLSTLFDLFFFESSIEEIQKLR